MIPLTVWVRVGEVALQIEKVFRVNWREITGSSRRRSVVEARHAAMLALREMGLNLQDIGAFIGGRDHTTVIHGIKQARINRQKGYSPCLT